MYLLILVCFIEHIAIYATTLMGRGTMYDKYLLWFKAEIHPLRFFAVLQLSKHQHSGYLVEFVDLLAGLVSNTSKSS